MYDVTKADSGRCPRGGAHHRRHLPVDHRMKFRDYVGHVVSWDGYTLEMVR